MTTRAERRRAEPGPAPTGAAEGVPQADATATRSSVTPVLAGILLAAVGLRVIAIQHGLPFAFNPDEEGHFVPHAAAAADGDLNPRYFDNPSALTYLLAVVLRASFGGDVTQRLADDPTAVLTVARLTVALVGSLVVLVVHLTARRFWDRTTGVLAAALIAVAFLPVHYSHQALNDVVTLLPLTVGLLASLLLYERGTWWSALGAGAAVGVAAGTKYLAAPMVLVIALAVLLRMVERHESIRRGTALLLGAALACLAGLLVTNPYLVLEADVALGQITGQSSHAATAKLGQGGTPWLYYPQSLLWGLGVVPVLCALVGLVAAFRSSPARCLLLVTFPVVLYVYLSTQERFFGRWLLPAYPAVAILAGYGMVRVGRWWQHRLRAASATPPTWPLAVVAVIALAQPLVDSVRNDVVLAHTDTRLLARSWIHEHVPDRRIVVEPSVPRGYLADGRFETYPVSRPYQSYQARLRPELVDSYRRGGFCWVLVNSHQRERGRAAGLPGADAYYDRLERESELWTTISPYRPGARPPGFSYDLSFNWYPPAFARPGPLLEVRRLTDCASDAE